MNYTSKIINHKNASGSIDIYIYHLILNDISEVKQIIDNEINDIWHPGFDYSLEEVKKEIFNVISSKSEKQKKGICAEFFMHLFLRDLGYTQKCVFSNLEENSMKKGFDGFYEYSEDFWIAESKCAITEEKHKDKINEALRDIEAKVSSTTGNNPWRNAFNHILVRNSGNKNDSLAKRVMELSKDYLNNASHSSSEFNLIPTSTLFINNNQSDSDIKNDIDGILKGKTIKNMIVLCINNDIYDEFYTYLEGK